MNLPYTYIIEWSDFDGCFLGSIVELERNMTCGQTRIDDFKGSITYRTSKERHYSLAKQAKLYGKSINAFIDEAIGDKLKEVAKV